MDAQDSIATRLTLAFSVSPKTRVFSERTHPVCRETVPCLHPPLHSSSPVLDGEDGGLRYPKESKLLYELGRLLGVF